MGRLFLMWLELSYLKYKLNLNFSVPILREKYFKSGSGKEFLKNKIIIGLVVQLDRISDFGSEGWRFESSRGHFLEYQF